MNGNLEHNHNMPELIIVMGISGCGKSTLASFLADKLDFTFVEADDFHSTEAISMMSQGFSITTTMRQAWVDRLCNYLTHTIDEKKSVVLAYSGLKQVHRQQFRALGYRQCFLMLTADVKEIRRRMESRTGHFVHTAFLNTQLMDMESPTEHEIDIKELNANDNFSALSKQALELCTRIKNNKE